MYARVWKFVILPGKVEEFAVAAKSAIPILQRQPGFRSLLVLRTGPGEGLEATVISTWASIETLRDSETAVFPQALADYHSYCEHGPVMREEEVVVSDFASEDLDATVTKF
jgi:heme-degrading monooxygenase HmoA